MAGAPHLALALALPGLALAQTAPSLTSNGTSTDSAPHGGGGLSPAGAVALSVVFGGLGALFLLALLLRPAGAVALSVVFGGLGALFLLALLVAAALRLREKRRTEGSYRPSREELGGAARAATPGPPALRLPPEERLI